MDITTTASTRVGFRGAVVACLECDALQTLPADPCAGAAVCFRCGAKQASVRADDGFTRALALALTALTLFVAANSLPLMSMEGKGNHTATTIFGSALALYQQRLAVLGVLVLLTTIVMPVVRLGSLTYLVAWLRRGQRPPYVTEVFRAMKIAGPFAQIEILLLAMVVAYGKLASVFSTKVGLGLFFLIAFFVFERAALASLDTRMFWNRVAAVTPADEDEAAA